MNRRDMLRLFGVGSLIVPVVGGLPEVSARARLEEEPRITLVEAPLLPGIESNFAVAGLLGPEPYDMIVELRNSASPPTTFRFAARTFLTNLSSLSSGYETIDVEPFDGRQAFAARGLKWTISGELLTPFEPLPQASPTRSRR